MSVLKDLSNKVKKIEINTEGDVLDIKGTLEKNKFILDDKEELQLKRKLKDTKNQVAIAEPITPKLDKVKPK